MYTKDDLFERINKNRKNENSPNPDIEIICPNCKNKAAFFAEKLVGSYVLKPSEAGKMSCLNCGTIRKFNFTNKDYYYKIEIGKRFLYARSFEYLNFLKGYFEENKRMENDPKLDFPKEFYERRLEIVKKINRIIKFEKND